MSLVANPEMLLRMLQQRLGNPAPVTTSNVGTPGSAVNTESGGMLNPAGAAPGGMGTAVGAGASTPANSAVIQDPNQIQSMQTEIMRRMTEPIQVGQPPQPPALPAVPEMAPMPGGLKGRLVAGLSGIAGVRNPYDVMREKEFQDALAAWQAKVAPLQETYRNQLQGYEAQTKAQMEAAQAQRYGAMAAFYMAPYFGISRTGTPGRGQSFLKAGQSPVKFDQGFPISVTDPASGQIYPVDPKDRSMSAIPAHLQPFVHAAFNKVDQYRAMQKSLIQTRGEAFRLNTMYPVLDSMNGNEPDMVRGYEILNNPGRYIAGNLGNMAMNKQNILMDIGDLSKTVRADLHALGNDQFTGTQRALIAAALGAPAGQVEGYIQSLARENLTPAQAKYATDVIQLKENAMALRGIFPGGTTETMRAAIANTLVGSGTPNIPYGDIQLDALDAQIGRASRGVPKTPMRAPNAEIPQVQEGNAPPAPVRGPLASQGTLNIQARTAPESIRNSMDIQNQIPEYVRGADGKLHLKVKGSQ